MMETTSADFHNQPKGGDLTLHQFTKWFLEIQNQPQWRSRADREMDYVDGNQLDSELLRKQQAIGIPPAIENLIGPAVKAVTGFEAKTRTDWRVQPDGTGPESDAVAKALNHKLNQAERTSGADTACSEAFRPQYAVGLGWVEVSRESNPFLFKYRCRAIHRNEIFWDMLAKERDLSDARYLIRRKWTDVALVALKFPAMADKISNFARGWTNQLDVTTDGGMSTGLAANWTDGRGNSVEEQEWYESETGRVCLFEVWYRLWEQATVFWTPDGRVVEYDESNHMHVIAMAAGKVKPQKVVISRLYCSFWLGPNKLKDERSPYKHPHFPYVPFWGDKEDRTGVPVGAVKGMMYLQDSVNASISKIRWGLSAIRTERTEGAVKMTDAQFRQMIARPDADIVLDPTAMAKAGATFKVFRDFQLNEQQYKMLGDARMGIERSSLVTAGFQGKQGTATSGVQESTQIEQTTQSLGSYMDNFKAGRTGVGERLLSMIIEDTIGKPETVTIPGNAVREDVTVMLNQPMSDPDTGINYLTNDVERIRLQVALNDVPSTPSFRAQQLSAMAEAFKSMPPRDQEVALPHLLSLMDIPDKDAIIEDIQRARQNSSPEEIEARIKQAVDQALRESDHALRARELDAKYNPEKMQAEIDKMVAERVKIGIEGVFSSAQAAGQIASMPQIAAVADEVLRLSGWRPPTPAGVDPNLPAVQAPVAVAPATPNTSPQLPPVPQSPATGMHGIETSTTADNMTAQ